jgi:putative zinc finger/helix-turn-helix YgiT family protein
MNTEMKGRVSDSESCPMCGHGVRSSHVSEIVPYLTPEGEVSLHAQVPHVFCEACGYEGFGEAGERARTEAIYRYMGRLSPWEIVSIRESLGLSQAQFAGRLGVGRASLERWERGANIQNQSMDNLILLLSTPSSLAWLSRERARRLSLSVREERVINVSRFRALRLEDQESLAERRANFRLRRKV